MDGLPEWLIANLTARGLHDPDGVRRAARLSRCSECGQRVLAGLDGDVAAMPVECEPHEIDLQGETLALLLGLRTYTLTRRIRAKGLAWNLDLRDRWAIARGRRTALLAQHRCDVAMPPAVKPFLPRGNQSATPDGPPPF